MSNGSRLWLIDAGYLFNAQRSVGPTYHFDYLKLRQKLEETGTLWRAYYLNSTSNPRRDAKDAFHTWLRYDNRGPRIITKLYELKDILVEPAFCSSCHKKVTPTCPHGANHILVDQQQKGVDVGIATLALIHKEEYQTLVLSSGDVDLLDAIEHLSKLGKRIELLVFRLNVSDDLQSCANQIYWIDDFASEVERTKQSEDIDASS
jgi:uncharacterized LabA/DUF88 family protein